MNIYIYGNNDFKHEIHEVLDHANIKFKLDEYGSIVDVETLADLKNTIENFPDYIYLIDESKIIKKNAFKFFKAKDAIKHSFLIEHGIEDVQIDSLDDIPIHVAQRIEILEASKNFGKNDKNIQESIIEIVDEAYENDAVNVIEQLENEVPFSKIDNDLNPHFNNDFQLNTQKNNNITEIENVIKEIDEKEENNSLNYENNELDSLLNSFDEDDSEISSEDMNSLIDGLDEDLFNNDNDFDDLMKNLDSSILEDDKQNSFDIISENEIENILNEEKIYNETMEGVNMAEDFSSIDELQESDILNAFNNETTSVNNANEKKELAINPKQEEKINVNLDNASDIGALISKLLNNKTLEITIKVKD